MELKQVFSKIKETVNYESTIGRAASAVRHSVRVVGDKSKAVAQYLPHKNKKNIYEEKMHPSKHYHTLRECLNDVCTLYGNVVAYRQLHGKEGEDSITYGALYDTIRQLGTALLARGYADKHIAIIGENSIAWMSSYLSVVCGCGTAVPIDRELDEKTMAHQLRFADVSAVFFSATSLAKIKKIKEQCPGVDAWIMMRAQLAKDSYEEFETYDALLMQGKSLLENGSHVFDMRTVTPEDLCDIIFTSGTTGANKGVMLTQKNICTVAAGSVAMIGAGERTFSVLPINHAYEKNCNVLGHLFAGKTVCINDSMAHIVPNIKRFEPELCIMVPMILEIIVRKIKNKVSEANLEKTLARGIQVSNAMRRVGIDQRERIFRSILSVFGPSLRRVVSGGAPLKEETRVFLDEIGVAVVNGYGISECAPLVSANFPIIRDPGSVGYIMPGCHVRIADVNEEGEGEIQVSGDNVMIGYYKDPDSTAAVFTEDGWLKTEDMGHMDDDGFLYVSGRIKNLIILANGKNVSPEEVEDLMLAQIPYLEEVVAYSDDDNTGIYASCYLNEDFTQEHGDDCYTCLMNDIARFNQTVPTFKRIKDVLISDTPFEKTTTQKIQRFKVKKFQKDTKSKQTHDA